MKKIFKYTLLAASISLFGACTDMEDGPLHRITDDVMWDEIDKNGTVLGFYVNDIYNSLPDGFNRIGGDYLDAASGDAIPTRLNTSVEFYNNGRVSVINNPDPYWGNSYAGIRKVNLLLANMDRVPVIEGPQTNAPERAFWKAEARFIRAMLYFELLKRYGGVPLIGDRIFTLEDDLQIPRNTFAEVVDYIAQECDAIKGQLRPEPIADGLWGRIPRGAAYALKSRLYLYAASPLFNGVDVPGLNMTEQQKALVGYPTPDATRWDRAIQAAEDLKNLNVYSLYSTVPMSANFTALQGATSYAGVFTVKKNVEIILQKQRGNNQEIEQLNSPVGYQGPVTSLGRTSPTQNFVNAYTDLNGLPITEAGTVFDANNPYVNRDPRFTVSVFHNGMRWLNRPVETYDGGRDRPGGIAMQTRSGYYLRKFMANFENNTTFSNQSHNFTIFRYAEILLNYAEALNERGRTEEAYDQIKLIRQRAGIRAGTNNRFGIKAGISQEEMRALIKNERRIELAFEEHRFWDLRRWKDAPTVLNGPLQGVRIIRNTDGTLAYSYENIANYVFTPKLYFMPLPFDEVTKNLSLVQNPGW